MKNTLKVIIKGMPISDTRARLIALLVMGLDYERMALFTGMAEGSIRTNFSEVYGLLDIHCPNGLMHQALLDGYDMNGYYNGKDPFTPDERMLLHKRFPKPGSN